MAQANFVHLNCHSAFSLLEGALPIARIVQLAQANGMPAVGVADTANLFGALEFSEKAVAAGVQPIVGCKLPVRFEAERRDGGALGRSAGDRGVGWVTLIAQSADGFGNLVGLVSDYYLNETGRAEPLGLARLCADTEGQILITGGHDGPLYDAIAAGGSDLAGTRLAALQEAFGDRLYVAIARHDMEAELRAEAEVVSLAYGAGLPVVATAEPFFPTPDDHEAHDALLAVAEGRVVAEDDRRRLTPDFHFATAATMEARFADLPEAVENTLEIAIRCAFRPTVVEPILPRFLAGARRGERPGIESGHRDGAGADGPGADSGTQVASEADELRRQAEAGLEARLAAHGCAPGVSQADYRARLAFELDVIVGMNYPGYFLIVAEFITWAKAQDIPVGPGRGSGAGSVVAWALTITDLDPLRFGLLFERFLNPERVSMPDFDIDFCQERRDEVIDHVQARYGAERVAQIITFGTLQARAVLRDVGRVLEMPYGQVDRLCKMVPADPANPVTLADAVAGEPRFEEARAEEPVVGRLLDIALKLEGLYRHASTHAAGIVIADRPLRELVPLYRDPRSDLPVTQYNMKWVEQAGLVKFDFLGLKTLTVLDKAVALLARRGIELDLADMPLDDQKTFGMLSGGGTVGVFQVESQGMRRALVGMKPDRFEDIIALVALYRPGPMDNIPTYNRRKHGEERPDYLLAQLEPVLKETYGVIIYQEQVMQIAQLLSGYSLGEADLLRRAMGKKIRAEMDAQRARFVDGAVDNGVARADAAAVFDLVAKFASYGFNKSHAAAYALVAYQTAYLKANYPVEFLAASMSLDMGNTDKLNEFRLDARRLNIEVLPPDINRSGAVFDVRDGAIVYALSALKGVGTQVVEHIVEVRGDRPFADLSDLAGRIDPGLVNRRSLDCLAQAGAFDNLVPDRAVVMATIPRIMAAAQERVNRDRVGAVDLFAAEGEVPEIRLADADPMMPAERLQHEFDVVGAYLTAHPLDDYRDVIGDRSASFWAPFAEQVRRGHVEAGLLAGTVVQKQERRTRTGGRMGIVTVSDPTGQYEMLVYAEKLQEWREMLEPGQSFFLSAGAEYDSETEDFRTRLVALEPIDKAADAARSVRIFIENPEAVDRVGMQLDPHGESTVALILTVACGRDASGRDAGGRDATANGAICGANGAVSGSANGEREDRDAGRGAAGAGDRRPGRNGGSDEAVCGVREVEIRLPGTYRFTRQIAGAIKAVPGVADVRVR